jgi:hypothetical protein
MKKKKQKIRSVWLSKPATDDYHASRNYLTLHFSERVAAALVRNLHKASVIEREAKDLLRASQTHLLDRDDSHVSSQLKKIKKGEKMSPVLLVRGDGQRGVTLTIADGHHRICASWYFDEDAPIACCLVSLPSTR